MKVKPIASGTGPQRYHFFCPACREGHTFDATWAYDGNADKPTISPSLKVEGGPVAGYCCHSIITAGRIEFCGDCSHPFKGQTLDLPDLIEADGEPARAEEF